MEDQNPLNSSIKAVKNLLTSLLVTAAISVGSALSVIAADQHLTFFHPSVGNQPRSVILPSGTYSFRVDAEPDSHHNVEWYLTESGGDPVETEHFYFFDDYKTKLTTSGWVRAEVYKSDIF